MSHQGSEGWFPECILCHCGNVGPVVCLDPTCHEAYGARSIKPKQASIAGDLRDDMLLVREDGHWWKRCQLCGRRIHSDPGAFGSYAICVRCFNVCAARGESPPTKPWKSEFRR
jgi:hypothetical protein